MYLAPLVLKVEDLLGGKDCGSSAEETESEVLGLFCLKLDKSLICYLAVGIGADSDTLALTDPLELWEVVLEKELGIYYKSVASVCIVHTVILCSSALDSN